MKRTATTIALAAVLMFLAVSSEAVRPRVVRRGPRGALVVRPGFPILRPLPMVIVRAPRVAVRVAPAVFLPPVVWVGAVVAGPGPQRISWEDSESLDRDDGWTDFTLNVDGRGQRLFFQVADGRARLNFAEVVFENGEAQVVDFNEKALGPGLYPLLDFRDGRKVDHVRMVAAAASDEVKIVLKMEK